MRRFHASGAGQERLIWSPAVHAAFGERCYFYLVAGQDPARRSTFTEELDHLLDEIDIESRLVHVVYGEYDALVRIWATESARQRLLRSLRHGRLQIDSLVEFAADEVVYTFEPNREASEEISLSPALESAVRSVVEAEHTGNWGPSAESALTELVDQALVFPVPAAQGVKFYMFFGTNGTLLAQPRDRVLDALEAAALNVGVMQVSLYSGVGLSNYVLKGWVTHFDDLLESINRIRAVAKDLRLVPWTMIVANGGVTSGETIDSIQSDLPPALEEVLATAGEMPMVESQSLRRELASLPPGARDRLASEYRTARERLSGPDLERFVEIVVASALGDRKLFNRSLSYLASIEEDLSFVLPRVLAAELGQDWRRSVEDRGWLAPRELEESLQDSKSLSLASLLFLLANAADQFEMVGQRLASLPDQWRGNIRELLRLRNRYAHGSLWEEAKRRDFNGKWGESLAIITVSIALQAAVEIWAEEVRTG